MAWGIVLEVEGQNLYHIEAVADGEVRFKDGPVVFQPSLVSAIYSCSRQSSVTAAANSFCTVFHHVGENMFARCCAL